jgi:Fibronectin type III domain
LSLLALLLSILVSLAASCGKKSAPTLAAYEKPPAPVLLAAVHREGRIILSWSFPGDKTAVISGFTILKSSDKGFQRITVSKEERSFNDAGFTPGTSYTYKIAAQSLAGIISNESNALTFAPMPPPPPPLHLTFKIEDDSVVLSWQSEGDDILYNVYKSFRKNMQGEQPSNPAPQSENSFRDVFYVNRPVYYAVRSLRNRTTEDEGPLSQEIEINPDDLVPSAPRDLGYFAASGKVILYWKEPYERWIRGYRIYRRTDGHDYEFIGETQVPTFLDPDKSQTERDYRVNAVGPSMEGPGAEVKGVFLGRNDLQ